VVKPWLVVVIVSLSLRIPALANPKSLSDLTELEKAGAWSRIVDICSADHAGYRASNGTLSVHSRLLLEGMFRLKMFDELGQEATKILQEEEKTSTPTSEISLSMRLLICETKIMTGRCDEAVEQLVQLRSWLSSTGENSRCEWDWRFHCSIVNAYVRLRQWRLAIVELRTMLVLLEKGIDNTVSSNFSMSRISLLCLLSRVLLQVTL
jgi:hypothetical protein